MLMLVISGLSISVNAQEKSFEENWREIKPQTVTLFSRKRYRNKFEGYGKSAFSFKHGLRSDLGREITRNNFEILYGNLTINRDSDWFSVTMVTDDRSRIKDLGEQTWDYVFDVPLLYASVRSARGIRHPSQTETFEESSDGQVTKVVLGHMYVVHSKDTVSDFYTLFRVDELIPNDKVTISWKIVPSPE